MYLAVPWQSIGQDLALSLPRVQSLVGEVRSCKPHVRPKTKKKKKKKKEMYKNIMRKAVKHYGKTKK